HSPCGSLFPYTTLFRSFEDPVKAWFISLIELFTGKLTILRLVRKFERAGAPQGQAFWRGALDTMGIELTTPAAQLTRIPRHGPVDRKSTRLNSSHVKIS